MGHECGRQLASLVTAGDDNTDNWVAAFGGNGGEFTVTADDGVVTVAADLSGNTDRDWRKHRRV